MCQLNPCSPNNGLCLPLHSPKPVFLELALQEQCLSTNTFMTPLPYSLPPVTWLLLYLLQRQVWFWRCEELFHLFPVLPIKGITIPGTRGRAITPNQPQPPGCNKVQEDSFGNNPAADFRRIVAALLPHCVPFTGSFVPTATLSLSERRNDSSLWGNWKGPVQESIGMGSIDHTPKLLRAG